MKRLLMLSIALVGLAAWGNVNGIDKSGSANTDQQNFKTAINPSFNLWLSLIEVV